MTEDELTDKLLDLAIEVESAGDALQAMGDAELNAEFKIQGNVAKWLADRIHETATSRSAAGAAIGASSG